MSRWASKSIKKYPIIGMPMDFMLTVDKIGMQRDPFFPDRKCILKAFR